MSVFNYGGFYNGSFSGYGSGGTPTPSITPAPLPAMSSAQGINMGTSGSMVGGGNRFSLADIALPAGDWSMGFWMNVPADAGGSDGIILNAATSSSNPYTTNSSFAVYYDRTDNGIISVMGLDATGNSLGTHQFPKPNSGVALLALRSSHVTPAGKDVFVTIVKTGTLSQLWLTFDGHAPVKTMESYTTMGAITNQMFFGSGKGSTDGIKGKFRDIWKVSYALTKAQIQQIANGVDPTTLGTPAANDYRFLLNTAPNTTQTSTINGLTMTASFAPASTATATGIGYAALTEPVFLDPPGGDGYVFQHTNGSVSVNLSGTYLGTDGANIQMQVLDDQNNGIVGWSTIATAIAGKTWSATGVSFPKGKRWFKLQLRKVIAGVPSTDVITTTYRWGVGEIVMLGGQSLMEHMGYSANTTTTLPFIAPTLPTANPYGATNGVTGVGITSYPGVTPNGYTVQQFDNATQYAPNNRRQKNITGATSQGGLIKITVSGNHGLHTGQRICLIGLSGTTEANNTSARSTWPVTVIDRSNFTLDGSTFVNAYVSGGVMYPWESMLAVMSRTTGFALPDAHCIIANAISEAANAVVAITNQAVGGQAINTFYNFTQTSGVNCFTATAAVASQYFNSIGQYLWLHGHQNIGQTSYFSSGGSSGAWTGYGDLGTLYDFLKSGIFPNTNVKFGLAAFTSIGGAATATAEAVHQFRFGMQNWTVRKNASGDANVFFLGYYNDMQPQWENGTTQNAHMPPSLKGYMSQAARLGHSTAYKLGGVSNDATGPIISTGTRTGAIIDLGVVNNGGTSLKTLTNGARPTGFEAATDAAFTAPVTITNVSINGNTGIRITLSSDPGVPVYIRYQYGYVGNYTASTYITGRITNVVDNGAGLIRVTTSTVSTDVSPNGTQRVGGHGLNTGEWTRIEAVPGAIQANGDWQVNVIDAQNFDLVGSTSVGLGTFVAGTNEWQGTATGTVSKELGIPIYDNRTIGLIDTNGAPLQPTFTPVMAS